MATQMFVLALVLSAASGHVFLLARGPGSHGNLQQTAAPLMDAALRVHAAFVNFWKAAAPTQYNWGYDITDSRNGKMISQYESRYGDVAHGSYTVRNKFGDGITIFYNADDAAKQAVVLRQEDVVGRLFRIDRRSLLYGTTPALGLAALKPSDIASLASGAQRAHSGFRRSFKDEAPTRYSFEYDIVDSNSGVRISQYESMYDDTPLGSCSVTDVGGATRTIHYSVGADGEVAVHSAVATVATL